MSGARPERHGEGRHAGRAQSYRPRASAGEQGRDVQNPRERRLVAADTSRFFQPMTLKKAPR